jgi:hypothetical protein
MSKTITLRIWNEDEGRVSKTVEIDNVLNVKFETKYNNGIDFMGNDIEIFIIPKYVNVDFKFVGNKVFITIEDSEEQ